MQRPENAASTCCGGARCRIGPKILKVGFANINAKAEGIENRPAFREAFQRRRCLVPVDNFYEWKKTGAGKQPYAVALADHGLMILAGLWENWRSPAGEWVRSFAIVTTTPNELCAELHNRMPVVLGPERWLGMARGRACRCAATQGHARALSLGGNDMLAGEPSCWERQEQRSEPDRADHGAMNLHRWLAALLVLCALTGCAQTATGQGQTPAPSSPSDYGPERRGDMM
jgi:hypothetical protein